MTMKHAVSSIKRAHAAFAAAILLRAFAPDASTAQTIPPFFTDFSEGVPSGWERPTASSLRWEANDSLGVVDSGALVVDMSFSSDRDTTWLRTGQFNLETTQNPVLRMSFALVNSNFLPPILSLWFETRNGEWQRLTAWGPQFGEEPTIPVERSDNHHLPLTRENLRMVEVSYSLVGLRWRRDVRFELRAEMINGGWLILDNFRVESDAPSDVEVEGVVPTEVDLR